MSTQPVSQLLRVFASASNTRGMRQLRELMHEEQPMAFHVLLVLVTFSHYFLPDSTAAYAGPVINALVLILLGRFFWRQSLWRHDHLKVVNGYRVAQRGIQTSNLRDLDPKVNLAQAQAEDEKKVQDSHALLGSPQPEQPPVRRVERCDWLCCWRSKKKKGQNAAGGGDDEEVLTKRPRGWKLIGMNVEEGQLAFNSIRVFVIGAFKVGKSTLMGWLFDRVLELGHQVGNTRGLSIFTGTVNEAPVTGVDTEGFHQPPFSESFPPAVTEDFVIDFMSRTADVVILMMNRVSTQDIPVMLRIIRWSESSRNRNAKLVLVHNLKDITTPQNLSDYIEGLRPIFNFETKDNFPWVRYQPTGRDKTNYRASIEHYFIGDVAFMPREAERVVERLKRSIAAAPRTWVNFFASLQESLLSVLGKYYVPRSPVTPMPDQVRIVAEEDCRLVVDQFEDLTERAGVVGSKLESKIPIKWFVEPSEDPTAAAGNGDDDEKKQIEAKRDGRPARTYHVRPSPQKPAEEMKAEDLAHMCLVHLVVESPGVREEHVKVEIRESSVKLEIEKYHVDRQQFIRYVEEVELPFKMTVGALATCFAEDNKRFDLERRVLTLPIIINSDRADFANELRRIRTYGVGNF